MQLIAKTYWGGAPMNMRRFPEDYALESHILKAADFREHRAHWWTSKKNPKPKTAIVVMHPRGEFTHHYVIPRLVEAGVGCLAANTRNPNNDVATIHEEIILDVNSSVKFLRDRGVKNVVLIGNSGGGALNGFFQAQAKTEKGKRIAATPGGRRTWLNAVDMYPADGMIYLSSHKGEGMIMNEIIDPSVVDEGNPHLTDPELDMYDERNGFLTPGALDGSDAQWSSYDDAFVAKFRAAQIARVKRIDAIARGMIEENARAEALHNDPDFAKLSRDRQRDILRREAFEPVITIYRTMANLHYVAQHLDPSARDYGSIFSPRPDLMNWKFFGFGRYATPHAWLSTWSGVSSLANQLHDLPRIDEPSLFINAGKDQEIFPKTDAEPMFAAIASKDKTFVNFENARHYFEPETPGAPHAPDVEMAMDTIVPWILERFGA
jgi:pimeloyl-ACP methyl ester carboxylesterase